MSAKAVLCRVYVLLLIFACCWLGGCGDDDGDDVGAPDWDEPPFNVNGIPADYPELKPVVKPGVTVTITTRLAASEDPSKVYFTWVAKDSDGTLTPTYLAGTTGPKQTFKTTILDRYSIKVEASKEWEDSLSYSPRVVPYIYVTCLSEITEPKNGQKVNWKQYLKGDGSCLQSSAPQRSTELTLGDPVQEGYLVSVLVINEGRHSGKLSEALVVSPDGTWSTQVEIGEEFESGSFTLRLFLIDRNRIDEFERLIDISFDPEFTIDDINGKLVTLMEDETGREIFAETSYEVTVIRKPIDDMPDDRDDDVQE